MSVHLEQSMHDWKVIMRDLLSKSASHVKAEGQLV
jgi:hypothetical protein